MIKSVVQAARPFRPSRQKARCTGRRVLAAALAYLLAFPLLPASALGNEGCSYPCGHVHDETCGYTEGVEGADCTHTCPLCAPAEPGAEPCLCDPVVEGGGTHANPDCPYFAAPQETAVEQAAALFAALPGADSVTADMGAAEKAALAAQLTAARDALHALPEAEIAAFTETYADLLAAADALETAIAAVGTQEPEAPAQNGTPAVRRSAARAGTAIPTVSDTGNAIYANGVPIKIVTGSETGKTNILYDQDGNGQIEPGEYMQIGSTASDAGYDLSQYLIYGGSKDAAVPSTSITMEGGEVGYLYGGGSGGNSNVDGNIGITINGGTVMQYVYGGSVGVVGGNTNITITGGTLKNTVYGGDLGTIKGNTKIEISGGTVGYVCGGGAKDNPADTSQAGSTVAGSTAVIISGGTVSGVYGGGRGTVGTAGQNTSTNVTISGGEVLYNVYGGNSGDRSVVNGDANITITGGTVGGDVDGGGTIGSGSTRITGASNITITGGTVAGNVISKSIGTTISGGVHVTVGGTAKIGSASTGVLINSGSAINGVDNFKIAPALAEGAAVSVKLPTGYTDSTIATEAVADDVAYIKLVGRAAEGKAAYFDSGAIKVKDAPAAVELIRDGNKQSEHDTLADAISNAIDGDTLKIAADIDLGTTGVTISGMSLTLDLNGNTITYSGTDPNSGAVTLNSSASLTVTDSSTGKGGKLEATGASGKSIRNESTGKILVNSGTVKTVNGGTAIDNVGTFTGVAGPVIVSGGTVETANGGNAISCGDSTVTVSGGTVQATGSTGMAISSRNTITVTGGTVSSANGNAIFCGGAVNISGNSKVSAANSRAIYNTFTGKVTISGDAEVTSASTASGTIHLQKVPADGDLVVLDIRDNAQVTNTADGYAVYFAANGVTYGNLSTYYQAASTAQVGKVYPKQPAVEQLDSSGAFQGGYDTLADAISNAIDGDTLKINQDIPLNGGVEISGSKTLTLDLNGKAITGNFSGVMQLTGGASLIVKDGTGNGKLTSSSSCTIQNHSTGTITIQGGTVENTNEFGFTLLSDVNGASIHVSGGTVSATGSSGMAIYNTSTGKVTVSGDAAVTSANADDTYGTVYLFKVSTSNPEVVLDIRDNAQVTNTADGYAVYFAADGVTSDNLSTYYQAASGAQVGKIYPTPPVMPTVEVDSYGKHTVYANGVALIIDGTDITHTTIYVDMDGDGMLDPEDKSLQALNIPYAPADGINLTSCTVYGGSKEKALTGNPKITLTGGYIGNIYGGGYGTGGDVTGSPSITVTGGSPSNVYGGGKDANLTGNPKIMISGGSPGLVYGGGYRTQDGSAGNVTGDTSVTVGSGAKVKTSVYGGGNGGTVSGKATVDFDSPSNDGVKIYGGGSGATATVGSTEVTLGSNGTARSVSGGGGSGNTVEGSATVTVRGATMDVYGVSDSLGSTVGGQVTVTVDGAATIHNYKTSGGGLYINGGTGSTAVKYGVERFVIGTLEAGAQIDVVLPAGYGTGVIATQAAESDLAKLKLMGNGAKGKSLQFDAAKGEISVVDPPAAAYTVNGGADWTSCDSLSKALTAMAGADNAATYRVRLMQDAAMAMEIQSGTFTLDLNGFTSAEWQLSGTAKLTVTDSAGSGKIIGANASENAATPAVSATGQAVLTLASADGKAFTLQGGKGLASETPAICNGAPGVQVGSGAALTVSDPANAISVLGGSGATHTNGGWGGNAVAAVGGALQLTGGVFTGGSGGNGTATSTGTATGGQGGNGLYSSGGTLSATGGVFTGGRGGNSASGSVGASGGDGISLNSGGGAAVLTGLTCTGGAGGTGMMGGTQGEGLSADSVDVTINGGAFTGLDGCSLMNGIDDTKDCRWVITGGSFTGSSCGLYTQKMGANPSLSVTGGVFSGGNAALYANLAGALSGGTFTGNGADSYAVSYGYTSGMAASLLAPGMAYFGTDGQPVTEGLDSAALGKNTILRVAPAGSTPEPLYSISGTVSDAHAADLKGAVQLVQRGRVLQTVTLGSNPCAFTFSGVAPGIYTLVATNTVGGYHGSTYMTDTRQVTVSGGDVTGVAMGWSAEHYVSSEVEVNGDTTPPVSAGGLEQVAASVDNNSDVCTVRLTVEAVDAPADKAEIDALAAGKAMDLYLDLRLVLLKNDSVIENLTDAKGKILEITVPYDFTDKQDVTVYRKHGSEAAQALMQNDSGDDGTFSLDRENGCIHIYASKFSTYAVGYIPVVTPPEPNPSHSSSGSGASSSTITATAGTGGSISPSGKVRVSRNSSKSFTIKPADGYVVDDVLVDGKSVGAVERYTFEKVTKAHTIAASFREETGKAAWNPFTDVREGDWFYDSVKYAYGHSLMLGTSPSAFSPEASTERGMIVTVLWRMEGQPEAAGIHAFTDVGSGAYYADAVAWADGNGIVLGYGDGKFGPEDTITREQLAAILWRYAQYKDKDVGAGGTLERFTDAAAVSGYAQEAMRWATGQGILSGKGDGILDPMGQATRAETAAMLMRYLQGGS